MAKIEVLSRSRVMKKKATPGKRAVKIGSIHALATQLQELAVQAGQEVVREVDAIIMSGERDTNRMEHLLDHMLGFCFHDVMLSEFKRLCRYLYSIDPQAATDYVHTYWEMWGQDGDTGTAPLRGRQFPKRRLEKKKADLAIGVPKRGRL